MMIDNEKLSEKTSLYEATYASELEGWKKYFYRSINKKYKVQT